MRTVLFIVCAAIAAGCGGGSSSSSLPLGGTPPALPAGVMPVQFTVARPAPSTRSISVAVNRLSAVVANCSDSCSATVSAPIGSDTFAVKLYDSPNTSGNVLSAGSTSAVIYSGTANVVSVAFTGAVKKISLSAGQPGIAVGTPSTIPLTVAASDAGGNMLIGSYDNPITLSNSDRTGDTALNTHLVSAAGNAVSLTYNGAQAFDGTTVSAAAAGALGDTLGLGNPCASIPGVKGYYPCDLKSAYNVLPLAGGTGQTVAIVAAFDDPSAQADLAIYRRTFGLPECSAANGCFRKVNQTGGAAYPSADASWAGEISLDLDMVSAMCASCHILLVEADSNLLSNLGSAVNTAAALGANAISNSYGGPEDASDAANDTRYYNHPGIAITASSGDHGYKAGVNYPAASQYVTAVGGTRLLPAQNVRGWTETAWSGAGSGCSLYHLKPSWQKDKVCLTRSVADVSAIADPNTGVAVYDSYNATGWIVYGGTSVATPIIAALFALGADSSAQTYGSYPYAHAASLYDITSGNNGSCSVAYYCTAQPGYDGPTGLGTPNGSGAFGLALAPAAMLRTASSSLVKGVTRRQPLPDGPSQRLCSLPAPHYAACDAIRRTDIGSMSAALSR